jgi:hypothetical protein
MVQQKWIMLMCCNALPAYHAASSLNLPNPMPTICVIGAFKRPNANVMMWPSCPQDLDASHNSCVRNKRDSRVGFRGGEGLRL